ncbi:MAG: hypothetical protein AAF441_03055 [Pseudomonadota bacterium]
MNKGEVRGKLAALQDAIRDYRAFAGEGAWFLTDGTAPMLPGDKLRACRLFPSRAQLYQQLDRPRDVAETGTQDGAAALQILRELDPVSLVCMDSNFRALNLHVLAPYMDRVRLRPGKPWVQLDTFDDNSFDFVVLAGVSDVHTLKKCLDTCLRTVRRQGLVLCAGFTTWSPGAMQPYGVYKSVCEFISANDVEMAYLVMQPHAFHDVVVRVVNK